MRRLRIGATYGQKRQTNRPRNRLGIPASADKLRFMSRAPSPTGPNGGRQASTTGRDAKGRFAPGNKAAKGNPHAKRVQDIRGAMLDTVTYKDVRDIVRSLIDKAKGGDVQAAREVLDRSLGKVKQPMEMDFEPESEEWTLEKIEQLHDDLIAMGIPGIPAIECARQARFLRDNPHLELEDM
mgnify:CR=1